MDHRQCFFCSTEARFQLVATEIDDVGLKYMAKVTFACREHIDDAWEWLYRSYPDALILIDRAYPGERP